jgi:hypothetical protein
MRDPNSQVRGIVPEDQSRLKVLDFADDGAGRDPSMLIPYLRQDQVILIRNVPPGSLDSVLGCVADELGLLDSLKLQSAFADFLGHRRRIGNYAMTVNKRSDFQFIVPHSEGDSFIQMQLASFYCYENSTDGGETILMNVEGSGDVWENLREKVPRIAATSRALSAGDLAKATMMYRLRSAQHVMSDDIVLGERPTEIQGLTLTDVLARPQRTHSRILDRDLFAYWASIAVYDFDALHSFIPLLQHCNLMREIKGGLAPVDMDDCAAQRIWSSGVDHNRIFRCRITHKLQSGELVLMNNMTWCHGVANWTPRQGVRRVAAAFA